MLSLVDKTGADTESTADAQNDNIGENILACLERHKETKNVDIDDRLPSFLHGSTSIQFGNPAQIQHFDAAEDTVVFAYDSEQNSAPQMALRNGIIKGQKLLFMDGELVVRFEDADSLRLADINIIETDLQH